MFQYNIDQQGKRDQYKIKYYPTISIGKRNQYEMEYYQTYSVSEMECCLV